MAEEPAVARAGPAAASVVAASAPSTSQQIVDGSLRTVDGEVITIEEYEDSTGDNIKVVIRPRAGLNVARVSDATLRDSILLAAGLEPETATEDLLRANHEQNILATVPRRDTFKHSTKARRQPCSSPTTVSLPLKETRLRQGPGGSTNRPEQHQDPSGNLTGELGS
ncbi:hypothetical protein HPB48_015254 [Haemaphysalis longicornis]|uniref:Uncharacterized protein n=1 Tax=Haemaphysalis longicornis TaxID=44386 RepID=A0A9J6FIY0_HAELO|nr:hypothetical protein HPB48_015254 [Haemaphysalis longicornis]